MKEQDKAMARDLSETDISSMPERQFKIMIVKVFIGFEKRVEDMSETLNTEIRNNSGDKGFNKQNEKHTRWNETSILEEQRNKLMT